MKKNTLKFTLIIFFISLCGISVFAQKTVKILSIGNSFSVDAQTYLADLAKAAGFRFVIGNVYIGGCSLEKHWQLANENTPNYNFSRVTPDDTIKLTGKTLLSCIQSEKWDYITLQQVSQNSGIIDTYFPYMSNLINYVKANASNPKVKIVLHQTWAYAKNSKHGGFVNYHQNQDSMYIAITNTVKQVTERTGIKTIIPSGTAIQNARGSYLGDNLCRDGFHLNLMIGRYIAGCGWFEVLFQKSVIGNTFIPKGVTGEDALTAQMAAHYAVLNPFVVTPMK